MNNPFQTPKATVELAEFEPPKPRAIIHAIRILWITMAIELLSMIPGVRLGYWERFAGDNGEIMVAAWLAVAIVFMGIYVALIIYLGRRANWARWAMLIYIVFNWLTTFSEGSVLLAQGGFAVGIDIGLFIADTYSMVLLFFGAGAQWFKATAEE